MFRRWSRRWTLLKHREAGVLITSAEVVSTAADSAQLMPMVEKSEESTGARVPITLADGGYHAAANLEAGARREGTRS